MAEHEWSTELDARLERATDHWTGKGIPTPYELLMTEGTKLLKEMEIQEYFEVLDTCR